MDKREAGGRTAELQAIAEYAQDYILLLDRDYRHVFVNRAFAEAAGRAPESFVGKTLAEAGMPAPLCRIWLGRLDEVARSGKAVTFDFQARLRTGRRILETLLAPVKNDRGEVKGVSAVIRDVTEWKRAELVRSSQNEVMRLIARDAPLSEVLETIVHLTERHVPGRLCSILLYDGAGRRLRHGCAPHLPAALIATLCAEPATPDNGTCGAAAFGKRLTVTADIESDPAWVRHRHLALEHGLRACWSHPITGSDGELLGTFDMYHRRAREPYAAELLAMSEAALVAGIAIQHWRNRDKLLLAHTRTKLLMEAIDEGIVGLDGEGRCTFVNPAATRLLGRPEREMLGRDFHELVRHCHEDGRPLARDESSILRCLLDHSRRRGGPELFARPDGGTFAAEYSVSPLSGDGGAASDRGAVLVFYDVSEKREMARQIHHQALHDPLTGLVNRRGFELRLQELLDNARDENRNHAFCYLDLDQFKLVNDTCGHAAGDELLRQLASLLPPLVRQNDTVARLGGDEFGVLLRDCPLERAATIAQKIRDSVSSYRFTWDYRVFSVGVSTGVVAITPEADSMVALLGAADTACYVAKDKGANQIHVSHSHDLAIIRRRGEMRWVARLKQALEENQFRLHFQSIAALNGGSAAPRMHELLIRLPDHKGQLILPASFLPAAERYQLMPQIDAWVIAAGLRFIGEQIAANASVSDHCFALNLSGASLRHPELLETIEAALARHRVPPAVIHFEITETAAIANLGAALDFMRRLKALGCRLALDDFGSGMSSFSYLKNLPVDFLKIDGSFVKDMAANPVDQAIVRAIHTVGRQMGLRTIAEYVNGDETIRLLREIGVDYAQGFGIAQPRPLEEFALTYSASAAGEVARFGAD